MTSPMVRARNISNRFGKPSGGKGYYSFDHDGVHFVALVNVMNFKPNGLGALGDDQWPGWKRISKPAPPARHCDLRPYADVDDLRTLGLGHGGCRPRHGLSAPLRFGDRVERPYPPDRAEGRRQHYLPYGPLHRLSPARGGRRPRPRPSQRAAGSARQNAGRDQHPDPRPSLVGRAVRHHLA